LHNNDEGRRLIRRAIYIYQKNGMTNEDLVDLYVGLAWAEYMKGDYKEAKRLMEDTIKIGKKVFTSDHPKFLTLYADLGRLETCTGNANQASVILQDVLPKLERVLGYNYLRMVYIYDYALDAEMELGEFQIARDLLKKGNYVRDVAEAIFCKPIPPKPADMPYIW
jgi:tetratricopeptide (TPR) repeat protein